MEEIRRRCRFCEKEHFGGQRVCRQCIERERPKISLFWIIFGVVFSAGVISLAYYLGKRSKQEEWDRINL